MDKLNISQKELIKRVKDLISLVEDNELANALTLKLRTTEEEILLKEKYNKELNGWKEEGFKRNWFFLKDLMDTYNLRSSYSKVQIKVLSAKDTYFSDRMTVLFNIDGRMKFREDFNLGRAPGDNTDLQRQENLERACKKITEEIFLKGLETYIEPKVLPSSDKATDPYWALNGIQVMRPTQCFHTSPYTPMDERNYSFTYPNESTRRL